MDYSFFDETKFTNRRETLSKRHLEEVAQTILNLEKAMTFFENSNVETLRRSGLVRREKAGILAVDQKGSKKNPPHLIRLYFFPWEDESGKHCMIFTIGDKNTQETDNNYCAECLKKHISGKGKK